MKRYFLISLFLHLLIIFGYSAINGSIIPSNFSRGSALPRNMVLTTGLRPGILESNNSGQMFEPIGVTELSNYAHPDNIPPHYPAQARLNHWQGESVILLRINKAGLVEDSFLLKSSGHRILDNAALSAVVRWKFPTVKRAVEVRFPVRFVLD